MAHSLYFDIPPTPKGRPRFSRQGGSVRVHKPAITRKFEDAITALCKKYWKASPLDGPLKVEIDFFITPPRTVKRKYPTVRPDVDNYCKSVLDAMNNIVYNDDAQIITLTANKIYREDSGIGVTIHELH